MSYTNSPLVTYTNITKNKTSPRKHAIDTITIHCIVGQWTAKQGCDYFATTDRECSANYVVGKDGSIGLSVDEKDRSWCSSNSTNDHRAITIEVASDTSEPYAVTDAAYNALIKLVADICKRNGIKKLVWSTSKTDRVNHKNGCNMTVHRDFANKSCPGTYLYERHGKIAEAVNKLLAAETTKPETTKPQAGSTAKIKANDVVTINSESATYYDGVKKVPAWVRKKKWIVKQVSGDRAVIDKSQDGKNAICSAINVKFLTVEKSSAPAEKVETFKAYIVKVTASALNIRKGPGTNYGTNGVIRDKGVYTIVAESTGKGATKWGKLKSGAGWISLDYAKKL